MMTAPSVATTRPGNPRAWRAARRGGAGGAVHVSDEAYPSLSGTFGLALEERGSVTAIGANFAVFGGTKMSRKGLGGPQKGLQSVMFHRQLLLTHAPSRQPPVAVLLPAGAQPLRPHLRPQPSRGRLRAGHQQAHPQAPAREDAPADPVLRTRPDRPHQPPNHRPPRRRLPAPGDLQRHLPGRTRAARPLEPRPAPPRTPAPAALPTSATPKPPPSGLAVPIHTL